MDIWPFGRKKRKASNESGTREQTPTGADSGAGLAGGCFGIIAQVAVWVLSALLVTVGLVLLLFGILGSSDGIGATTIIAFVIVPVGVFVLLRIGKAILKDMREK